MSRSTAKMPVTEVESIRCPVCRKQSMRRREQAFEYEVEYDGRGPYRISIPDLSVIACTNPDCRPGDPADQILHDDATTWRITVETYRQLGLLTPDEIRVGRERLGLNQQEFQELLRLGGNTLSRWENGRVYQSRSMDTLLRLAFNVRAVRTYLLLSRAPKLRYSDPGSDECLPPWKAAG